MSHNTIVPTARTRSVRARVTQLTAVAALAGAACLGLAAPAFAHDELISTQIVADPDTGVAEAFELSFSNSIIEVGTEIIVTGPDGADATDGAPSISGPNVTQPLADLTAGEYTAAWRVVSSDGHPIEGAFGVAIAKDGSGEIVAAPTEGAGSGSGAEATDEATATESEAPAASGDASTGMPLGGIIAMVVGGVVVVAGGVTAAVVAGRRRAQGMSAAAAAATEANTTEASTTAPQGDVR